MGFNEGRERRSNCRNQGKVICICPEGAVTEKSYLDLVQKIFKEERRRRGKKDYVKLRLEYTSKDDQSAPTHLLKKMRKKLKDIPNHDGAWIISDRDDWTLDDLKKINEWSKQDDKRRRWILSNQNIEYWFGLHFQNKVDQRVFEKKYDKHIENNDFTYEQIVYACKKARAKKQTISDLYDQQGSLMYEIVEFIGKEYQLCSEDSRVGVSWKFANS